MRPTWIDELYSCLSAVFVDEIGSAEFKKREDGFTHHLRVQLIPPSKPVLKAVRNFVKEFAKLNKWRIDKVGYDRGLLRIDLHEWQDDPSLPKWKQRK